MNRIILIGTVVLVLTACVSQTVQKVVGITTNDEICIIDNPAVRLDFLTAYKSSIESRGYQVSVVNSTDNECSVTSTYTANYGMHWGMYLARADLKIFKNGELVGRAQYKAPRADPNKHGRVAGKIDKLLVALLPD